MLHFYGALRLVIMCRCRQVTASLPDMAALQAAIRGQPRPGQPGAEKAESRLLPDVAVAERANTLQTVQAAAEQVWSSCHAYDLTYFSNAIARAA